MWTDNTGNAKIKILSGYVNIYYNICFEIKERKITRGHNYALVKKQSSWTLANIHFQIGPSMLGTNDQLIVYMLVVLICSRTKYKSI